MFDYLLTGEGAMAPGQRCLQEPHGLADHVL